MDHLIGIWSHALGALAFAAVLLWQLRSRAGGRARLLLLAALLLSAVAAWLQGVSPDSLQALHAESLRNILFVAMLFVLSGAGARGRQHGVTLVYAAVGVVLATQLLVDSVDALLVPGSDPALEAAGTLLRALAAAGALILVHNLYGQSAPASRIRIRLPMLGLTALWSYELNLYTMLALGLPQAGAIASAHGIVLMLVAPTFALNGADREAWRPKLSRAATFQSISLLAICGYFAIMALLAGAFRAGAAGWISAAAIAGLAGLTLALAVLLPSARARAWVKVKVAKHFFEHRYDYRSEWLRFAATLGAQGTSEPLGNRIVRAFADMLEAPGGLLLAPDEGGRFGLAGQWQWTGRLPDSDSPASHGDSQALWAALSDGRVVELDAVRHGLARPPHDRLHVPDWLREDPAFWVAVPLVHGKEVIALVCLTAPDLRRPLDWEDFDLLRTAGLQAASSFAEAVGQKRLAEVERFDEFNRRFAFILHDIKNLVSQLKLLSRNAERHADNPEWRADMVATLQGSVGKMTELLARLSPTAASSARPPLQPVLLRPLLAGIVAGQRVAHEVRLLGSTDVHVLGDRQGLEQAVGNLVANAVEASPPAAPVIVRVDGEGDDLRIEIADQGPGMDRDFIANRLFTPFASTKESGFGIGAYEARTLIHAMGGRLSVDSRPGEGTRFAITLPRAPSQPAPPQPKDLAA